MVHLVFYFRCSAFSISCHVFKLATDHEPTPYLIDHPAANDCWYCFRKRSNQSAFGVGHRHEWAVDLFFYSALSLLLNLIPILQQFVPVLVKE